MNVSLVNRSLSLFAVIALALTTMSFRAPESPMTGPTSVVVTSSAILVNPNLVPAADHVIVTLQNATGAVVGTRYTTPGQVVSFTKPSDSTSGYVIRTDYFGTSNEYMIGDETQI